MKKIERLIAAAILAVAATQAQAELYTTDFGAKLANLSNCDDCSSGPIKFGGAGQRIDFFGQAFDGLYVNSNGNVTFGQGVTHPLGRPLDTQTLAPMIAALWTDMLSAGDALSNVYVNTAQDGQLIATWEMMGHFNHYLGEYAVRSTVQLVVRSDQYTPGVGEGRIGFFYDAVTDDSFATIGIGDGLAAANPGELSLMTFADAMSNAAGFWRDLDAEPQAGQVPEPGSAALLGLGLAGALLARRRREA